MARLSGESPSRAPELAPESKWLTRPRPTRRVFFIVVTLECFRRFGREYDRAIKAAQYANQVRSKVDSDEISIPAPFAWVFQSPVALSTFEH